MVRVLGAAFAAAVAVFFWGFLFWATPLGMAAYDRVTPEQEAAISAALKASVPANGVYQIPDSMRHDSALVAERYAQGPIATVMYRAAGAPAMDPMVMVKGFGHMLVSFLVLGAMLALVAPKLPSFAERFWVMMLAAVAMTIWANLGNPIWFLQPWTHHVTVAIYDVIAWLLGGAILAWLVRPRAVSAAG
jgi:hypothetical protein